MAAATFAPADAVIERAFVTLEGRQAHVRRAGSGPAAVLLAPLPYSAAVLDPLTERLGARFTAIAPDLAGYGASAPLRAEPTVRAYAAELLALLDALGIGRFGLYGQQFGALVAAVVAAEAADRVTSFVVRDLPVLTEDERTALGAIHLTPIEPRLDGGHLLEHWRLRRDEHVRFPPAADGSGQPVSYDLQRAWALHARLDRGVIDQMAADPDCTPGYRAMLSADAARLVEALPAGGVLLRTVDDLFPWAGERLAPGRLRVVEAADEGAALLELLRSDQPAAPAAPATTPLAGGLWRAYARTSAGQILVRRRSGGDGVPLVLFHPSPGSGARLEPLLRALDGRSLYALDMLGVGGSSRPEVTGTPVMAAYASVVRAALDDLGLDRVDLYGSHTGALLALETALLLGDRARRVVLHGVPLFTRAERDDFLAHHFVDLSPRWDGAHLVAAWGHARDVHQWFPWFDRRPERIAPRSNADAGSLQAYVLDLLRSGPSYVDPYRAVFLHETRERLPLLRAPAVLVHGPGDPLARFTFEAAALAGAGSLQLDDGGPPAVAEAIRRFTE